MDSDMNIVKILDADTDSDTEIPNDGFGHAAASSLEWLTYNMSVTVNWKISIS